MDKALKLAALLLFTIPSMGQILRPILAKNPASNFTAAPINCHTSQSFSSGSSDNVNFPSCKTAGDLVIVAVGAQNAMSSIPTGWSALDYHSSAANFTGEAIYKQLTSADVSTGFVTLTFGASGIVTTATVEFVGLPKGGTSSGDTVGYANGSDSSSPNANPTSYGVIPGDTVLWWGSNRGTATNSVNRGTTLEQPGVSGAFGVLSAEVVSSPSSGGLTPSFTFGGFTGTGVYSAAIIVHGGTTYTPEAIPGLQVWISADCITRSGTTCATPSNGSTINASGWVNRYGGSNTVNPSITGTCTFNTNQINSLPAVTFSTCAFTPTNTGTLGFATPTQVTTAAVWANASSSGKGTLIGGGTGSPAYWTCSTVSSVNRQQGFDRQSLTQIGAGTATCDTSWHQGNAIVVNLTNPAFRLNEATDTALSPTPTSFTNNIGAIGRGNSAEYLNGRIAELVYYDQPLTSAQITILEAYFNSRYGI